VTALAAIDIKPGVAGANPCIASGCTGLFDQSSMSSIVGGTDGMPDESCNTHFASQNLPSLVRTGRPSITRTAGFIINASSAKCTDAAAADADAASAFPFLRFE
jgi:hypothetical protein